MAELREMLAGGVENDDDFITHSLIIFRASFHRPALYIQTQRQLKVKAKSAMPQLGRRQGAHLPLAAVEPVGG